jgi:hypothetical protein
VKGKIVVVAALVAGLTILAGCGGSGSSTSDPATFARQWSEHSFKGDGGWLYYHLHPAQRRLVSYNDFTYCLHVALQKANSLGLDVPQTKVTRVTTGTQTFVNVPGTDTVSKAVPVTVYTINAKHPGEPIGTTGHVFVTKEGLRFAEDAATIAEQRHGKCLYP